MAFILLTPATIILAWKVNNETLKGKVASSDLIGVSLVLGSAFIAVVGRALPRVNVSNTPLAQEVFELVDAIWLEDENI
jgi:hypothetical protein